ncbi:DNA-binding protein [Phytohabitans sp. ZYX-F-186]|uniref:DNA-binding protein n=1 Tax=Phytohabitans maris TaxID=3071409 RepID=A0ABU0ZAV3_9ACTN|nr:DNA-binding protein [Phytohabitans sp. ZYX-F-186]MDQ7903485.1 DNA-binding protein [Phytohabitans sp. ZYX-F-186]
MSNNRRSRTARRGDHQTGGGPVWTAEAVRALGAFTDLHTAAQIFGLAMSTAYLLAKRGQFPVPVIRAGTQYRVPVQPIIAALHLEPEPDQPP